MVDKRYQIFISTSGEGMSKEYRILCQTLIGLGYFAWGVENRCTTTATLARRKIDESDYITLLLGSDYGQLSVSGVSYMQLEYIYALARQKSIIVFMQKYDLPSNISTLDEAQQKFYHFRQLIQQEVKEIFEYDHVDDLVTQVKYHMPKIVQTYPTQGWVRAYNTRLLQDEIQRLKHKVAQFELQAEKNIKLTANQSVLVQLSDLFTLSYQVCAHENDSFERITRSIHLTWLEILQIIAKGLTGPVIEDVFLKRLNQYLMQITWQTLSKENPLLSHITHVDIDDYILNNIKIHIKDNAWIVPIGRDHRQRLLWKVSINIQNILKKMI